MEPGGVIALIIGTVIALGVQYLIIQAAVKNGIRDGAEYIVEEFRRDRQRHEGRAPEPEA